MGGIKSIQIDTEKGWRGGQRQVELLCKGLAEKNHHVTLITKPDSVLGRKLSVAGIEVVEVKTRFEFDPLAVDKIVSVIRDKKPDIVGMHTSHSHTLGVLAKRFIRGDARFVVTRRVDFKPGRDPLNKWKYLRGPDAYIAISSAVKNVLINSKIMNEQVHLVHSGVAPVKIPRGSRKKILEELKAPEKTLLVGDVASLVDHKGHKYLLDAIPAVIEEIPGALFVLAGEGNLRNALEIQAQILGITDKNIRFLGHRDDIPALLGAMDLFVMTSHLEGLCTSIIDAMLAKVPVVATKAGGIPDLITDRATGLLAENRSPDSIAKKLIQALKNASFRKKIAKAGNIKAGEEFTSRKMVESTIDAYQKIINTPKPKGHRLKIPFISRS